MFEASPDLPRYTDADAADANGEGAGQGTVQGEDEEIPKNEDGGTKTATADNSTDVAEKSPVETGVVAVGVAPLDGTGEVKEKEKEGEEAMEVDDQGPPDDNDAPGKAPDQAMNITGAEVGGNEGDTEPSPGLQGTKSEVIIDGEAEGQDEGETEGELVGETKGATKGTEKDEGESKGCGDDCNEGSIEDRPDSEPVAIAASQAQVVSRRRSTRIKNLSVPDRHVSASSIAPPHTRKNLAQKRKRDMADGEQEPVTEDPPAKKSKTEVDLDFSPGWTRGRFVYKKGRDTRVSWVSPARKIEFKYRKEAILFDSLRTQCEGDEVKAWIEYTKIKDAEKKTREVVDPRGVDEELGLDITMIRSKNTAETKIGAGWEVSRVECGKVRNRWISPVRKMSFRYLMDAILFESLRKQYGEDEIQAWVEYTKIRYLERKNREVENAEQFDDDNIGDVWVLRKNADNDTPGPGWVYSTVPRNGMRSSKTGIWISPIRKMRFRNRKDAVLFESLRMKYGTDEIKAWVEYSKIKHSKNERREVLECHIYDTVDGSATGRWTKAEHKLFLKGLSMFGQNGRNYRKISELIGSRSYDQVKSYGKRFFYNGGKEPAKGVDSSSSDEDSIEEEEEQKELQLKPQAKPTRRRSTSTIKNTSISMNDDTAKTPSLKQSRRSLPMRGQPSRVQPSRSGKVKQSYEEDTLTSFDGESRRLNKRKQQKTSASPQSKASLPKDAESSSINEEADISKEEKDTKQKKKVALPATTLHSSRRVRHKQGSPTEPVNEEEAPPIISVDNESKQGRRRTLPLRVQKRKVSTDAQEGGFSEPEKVNSSPDHKAATKPVKPKPTRRISVRHLTKEPPATFETLSTDDLYRIASFSSTVKDLTSFCLISKLTNAALAKGTPDEIYRTLFLKEFGEDMCVGGDILANWTWKERWTKLWFLRRGFRSESSAIIMPSSVGVLRWEKEEAALFEDNPLIAPVDRDVSKGYFGLQALHNLPKPPKANDSPSWEPPILLHGDFDGVKIYHSAQGLLSGKRRVYLSMGEEHGQVTSLVVCKFTGQLNEDGVNPPCCFLGYASGVVATLTATLSEDESCYHFHVERPSNAHNSKVSAMTLVNCRSNDNNSSEPVLLSACYDGEVCYYPNAMNPNNKFDTKSVFAFSNSHPDLCPILSMTSTSCIHKNQSSIIVCTGDSEGSVRLWLATGDLISDIKPSSDDMFCQVKWYKSKGRHSVTTTKFLSPRILLSGNNQGDIRVWEVEFVKESSEENIYVPGLNLRYFLKCAHNGPVETCMNIGDVIVTSGGNHGSVNAWDMSCGKKIGTVSCHDGQETVDESSGEKGVVKSCPVGVVLVNNRLITVCRDGMLAEWKFCQ